MWDKWWEPVPCSTVIQRRCDGIKNTLGLEGVHPAQGISPVPGLLWPEKGFLQAAPFRFFVLVFFPHGRQANSTP